MRTGVPHCSELGPLLFCVYITPLSRMLSATVLSYHFYADDTTFLLIARTLLPALLLCLLLWILFTLGSLQIIFSVNPSKTEFLIIGTLQQRSRLTATTLFNSSYGLSLIQHVILVLFFTGVFLLKNISSLSANPSTFKYVNFTPSCS